MRGNDRQDKSQLLWLQSFFVDDCKRAAQHALMRRVFGLDETDTSGDVHNWRMFTAFDSSQRCVASLEARTFTLCLDGEADILTGLRRIAVDADWRGLGLFRDLMDLALPWCAAQSPRPTLLFTAEPALYTRFGFAPAPQHAFDGAPPQRHDAPSTPARRLDPRAPEDAALIKRLLATRMPVSRRCALADAPDIAWQTILAAEDLIIAHAADLDAIVLYEQDDAVTIVDVVAAKIPSMAAILAAIGVRPNRVTTLFPPDRLDWTARPRADDTGLMARGPLPPAMTRPFMLPPTAEF